MKRILNTAIAGICAVGMGLSLAGCAQSSEPASESSSSSSSSSETSSIHIGSSSFDPSDNVVSALYGPPPAEEPSSDEDESDES